MIAEIIGNPRKRTATMNTRIVGLNGRDHSGSLRERRKPNAVSSRRNRMQRLRKEHASGR